ncbi:hypothetical protein GRJ2_000520800 [Grus japonensis]|uniref:Uncharacterized protein n=1 Tax=Grus japonensis TaxID=30415 RepID=A0ABC9W657_GRUJA
MEEEEGEEEGEGEGEGEEGEGEGEEEGEEEEEEVEEEEEEAEEEAEAEEAEEAEAEEAEAEEEEEEGNIKTLGHLYWVTPKIHLSKSPAPTTASSRGVEQNTKAELVLVPRFEQSEALGLPKLEVFFWF